mgnify:CR=1 FL=1
MNNIQRYMVLNSFLLGVIPVMGQQKGGKTYFKLGLDYESIYASVCKQGYSVNVPKQKLVIRRNLQLNPVSIYTKFWTVSARKNKSDQRKS